MLLKLHLDFSLSRFFERINSAQVISAPIMEG
jgi:hypothetical protein